MTYIEKILRKEKCFDSLIRQSSLYRFRNVTKTNMKMYHTETMIAVAETINRCLAWSATVEGMDYWRDLYNKYRRMSSDNFKKLLTTNIKYNKDLK